MMNLWKFIVRRAAYHRYLFISLALGMVLGISLLASGPLIIDAVISFSIPYKLSTTDPIDGNIRLTTYGSYSNENFKEFDSDIRRNINTRLGGYISSIISRGNTAYLYPWIEETLVENQRVSLNYFQGIKANTHLISGKWPDEQINDENELRVVISEPISNDYNLSIGDKLPLSYLPNENKPSIWFIVSGIISPNDAQDIYWFENFYNQSKSTTKRWSAEYNVFVNEEDFFEIDQTFFPSSRQELHWDIYIDAARLKPENISPFIDQLNNFRLDLSNRKPELDLATNIDEILSTLTSRARTIIVILYLMIGEVLFLAAYYIVMMSTLFVDNLRGEFSNLSSRGSSLNYIYQIQILEALLMGSTAFLIGILLALTLVWGLAEIGPIADVKNISWNLDFTYQSWITAGFGLIICILGLMISIRSAIKGNIVLHSKNITRQEQPPFWQRYYLDITLLLVGLILFGRLMLYGGISEGGRAGSIDWLLLLSPLVFLIGGATILYRIFPPVIRTISKLLAKSSGFSAVLAMIQLSRNPTIVSKIVLLMVMTMALGVLASGLNATLDASESERALYAVGSPIRLEFDNMISGSIISETIRSDASSAVYRSQGSVSTRSYRIIPSYELIAIDPYTFINVTKFRSDYAAKPMGQILGRLVVDIRDYQYPAINLPGKPIALGVWIYNDSLFEEDERLLESIVVRGKIQTAEGEVFKIQLLPQNEIDDNLKDTKQENLTEGKEWYYFECSLPNLAEENYPISLHSLWFNMLSTDFQSRNISLLLDDISLIYPDNDQLIIDDFEILRTIWQVNDQQANVSFTRLKTARSGTGSLNLILPRGQKSIAGFGIFPAGKLAKSSIPVLASEEFLNMTELEIGNFFYGDVNSLRIPMYVAERVNYFPTLYDRPGKGFLILPFDPLLIFLNQETITPYNANELWINRNDFELFGNFADKFPSSIKINNIEQERRSIKADPLSLGLRSVTLISYIISVILSIVGFSSYFYISARSREIQFAVLRSLGMSKKQLYAMLSIEQLVIIMVGLTIGLLLGVTINMIILPGLPLSISERPPIPPFLPHINWYSILNLYLMMVISFIILLGISLLILWKLKIHEAMRIGME